MKILFCEVDNEDRKKIQTVFPNSIIEEKIITPETIHQKKKEYADIEILCPFIYSQINKKIIDALPKLKLIITRSVGYNHIDLEYAKKKNITICNVPDYGSHVIAEHVFALLLSTIRKVQQGDQQTENNNFDFHGLRGMALKCKKIGIIGTGKIGKNVARIASMGFLMDVLAYDKYPDEEAALSSHFSYVDSVEEIWKQCDIISLHVPAFPDTIHMVNKKSISLMKKGVVLINTARGKLIKTSDLIDGIESGKISYAALDVLEHEKNIKKNAKLLQLPQVVVTPHIAFYADDSMNKMYEEAMKTIKRFEKGEKLPHKVKEV